jgi:predicted Zn-dependent peptidase
MELKTTATNGINVYYYKLPNTHSVCISLYVKTGSLYEDEHPGISHFIEHLHFRKLGGRTQKQLYYELESLGAYFNACTSKEYIRFFLTSSPKHFSAIAGVVSDLLCSLDADARDVSAEKRLILSEIRENNHVDEIDNVSNRYIWDGTNLKHPVPGYISSVKELTLPILQAEKERTFTCHNAFYYVTGCFEDSDIDALLKGIEGHDLSGRTGPRHDNMAPCPAGFKRRNAFTKLSQRKTYMFEVEISFDVDLAEIDLPRLDFLDGVLTKGLCSLMRGELVEKRGLVYDISSYMEMYRNIGVYYFSFTVGKSNFYEALRTFVDVIKGIRADVPEANMRTTSVFKTDNQLQMLDDPESINSTFSYMNHILDRNYRDVSELSDDFRGITRQQITETANKIFSPNNATLIAIGPQGLSETKAREILLKL